MRISIIIPTYNEAENIAFLVAYLKSAAGGELAEIIVADGGSADSTVIKAVKAGAKAIVSPVKGRAGQMNCGAKNATGDVLYFVHADTRPPLSFYRDISEAVNNGCNCGSYRFKFDSNKFLLKINSFFTRFNFLFFRGGDQSIFVTNELFNKIGGFNDQMMIMEDYDFLEKIWTQGKFKLIPKATQVSARKYDTNSWLRVQLANLKIVKMFRKGASQQELVSTYRRMLNYRKNAF
ncbi:MAG: TIGR04283 family arsenosugar biosynthesis glycosyltransferase [Taibaiella sp.]|nr:TIGR04283 family arsenosugar biosynthesis glycosyltransferase [Taibaiella sp.]